MPESCPAFAPPVAPTAGRREAAKERSDAGNQAALIGEVVRARELFLRSAELDPTLPEVAYRLGRVYEELGQSGEAAREYCRALFLGSGTADDADVRARIARLIPLEPAVPALAAREEPVQVAADTPLATEALAATPAPPPDSPRETAAPSQQRPVPREGATLPALTPEIPRVAPAAPSLAPRAGSDFPEDAADGVRTALAAYARAIESRDLTRLRDAYPEMTAQQQRAWEGFFDTVRELKATLAVERLDVTGTTAQIRVGGSYEYLNRSIGRVERSPVTFRATLERGPDGWRLRSIR